MKRIRQALATCMVAASAVIMFTLPGGMSLLDIFWWLKE